MGIEITEKIEEKPLLGKSLAQLQQLVEELGQKKFVAKQLAEWLYVHRVAEIEQMSSLSKPFRERLAFEGYIVGRVMPMDVKESRDGTKKYMFGVSCGVIESAYIPDNHNQRATLCVSSQVGCRMGCKFCMTGRLGFKGNLSANEIINQIFSIDETESLTNIVFMGMGEPLDNLSEVMQALDIITAPWGMAWSPTRVTLSTIGIIDALKEFLDGSKVHLAVSLHAPVSEVRLGMMPAQNKYPIAKVVDLLKQYDFTHQRRLSFEYTLFDGINDSLRDAAALALLINGTSARVNLIRYHRIPDSELAPAKEHAIALFKEYLEGRGIITTVRASRGEDIYAACGMLAGKADK